MSIRRNKPPYTKYRARPPFLARLDHSGDGEEISGLPGAHEAEPKGPTTFTRRRIIKVVFAAIAGWLLLSVVLFFVSAQVQSSKVSESAKTALDSGGYPLTSPTNILVLGSDARPKNSKEPGASSGPSRADTIMLVRTGDGHSAKLSIPRDTIVNIPGHGPDKINAAYAIGGPALMITTIKQYLGIKINHLVEVNFENFPAFIDALGGVNFTGDCVVSKINGGFKNGGFTLRLKPGKNHLNGKQALALARTRKNECNPRENDLTRASRQQKLLQSIRGRLLSPITFFRLPWVAWGAPQAIRSDMGGPTLLGVFGSQVINCSGKTRVLKPSGNVTLANGGAGLSVSDSERRSETKRFLSD